jgi:hypothetical protein
MPWRWRYGLAATELSSALVHHSDRGFNTQLFVMDSGHKKLASNGPLGGKVILTITRSPNP